MAADPTPTQQAASAAGALATNANNASDQLSKLQEALRAINTVAAEHKDAIAGAAAAYTSLALAQKLMSSDAYKFLIGGKEEAAKVPRLIASEIVGANVLISEKLGAANDSMTRNALALQRAAYDDQEKLADRQIKIGEINGKAVMGHMVDYFRNAADLGKVFYDNALADTRLYSAAMKATTELDEEKLYRLKETSALAVKGLGVDAAAIGAIYQEEYSKTGKISGDMVENFAATIIAAAKETGLGTKQLAADMSKMVMDVEHFGNMSKGQMTSLSAAIHQLGIDMNDVVSVTGKFTSFENASQAIANIGAVTGATLDTMEMFYLANEDKEEFFRTMRQSLLDQGVSIENLSHQEQVYLSRQLGFNSVRQLQSLLNEEIDFTTGNITSKIEEAATSQENVGDKLTEQLAQAGGLAKETLAAMSPDAIAERIDVIKGLVGGTSDLFDATVRLKESFAGIANDALPAMVKSAKAFEKGFVLAMDSSIEKIRSLGVFLTEFAKESLPEDLQIRSVPKKWRPISDGLEEMQKQAQSVFDKLRTGTTAATTATASEITASIDKSLNSAASRFDKMRDDYKEKLKEVDKLEEKVIEDQKKRTQEAVVIEREYLNTRLSFTEEVTAKKIQEKFGGGTNEKFTDADVSAILGALKTGDAAAIQRVITSSIEDSVKAAEAQLGEGAKPVAPAAPGAAPAAAPAAAGTGTNESKAAPTSVPVTTDGNLEIKVKLELERSQLIEIISAEISDVVRGGLTLKTREGDYDAGRYKFVLEPMK